MIITCPDCKQKEYYKNRPETEYLYCNKCKFVFENPLKISSDLPKDCYRVIAE